MSGYRNYGRHSAPTDPMMTNSYLIRARTIRDEALHDADRRELIAQARTGDRRWTRLFLNTIGLIRRVPAFSHRRSVKLECVITRPDRAIG